MSFLLPGLLSGGMGLLGNQKTNQSNQNQQQQSIQNWMNAIKMFQQYMQSNPSPFGGGVNVQRPGQSGSPYNPGGAGMGGGPPRAPGFNVGSVMNVHDPYHGGGGQRVSGSPIIAPGGFNLGNGPQMHGGPIFAPGQHQLGGGPRMQGDPIMSPGGGNIFGGNMHGGPVFAPGGGNPLSMGQGTPPMPPGVNPMEWQRIQQIMNGGNPQQRGFYGQQAM